MVKAPLSGRVKTRLGREIGVVAATAFYRRTSQQIIQRLARDPRWETTLAVSPDWARSAPFWPGCLRRVGQGGGNLGGRMQRLMDGAGPGPVIVVGTDIPEMSRWHIADAFRLLGNHQAVLGPAGDGGYWLVGLKRVPRVRRIFERVRWSSPHALADTMRNIDDVQVAETATLRDVDTRDDHLQLNARAGRLILPPRSSNA